jgi:tetratricopeptide (TPR) repeat protein
MSPSVVPALRENMWRALAEGRLEDAEDILIRLKAEDPLSPETRGFELELALNSNRLVEASTLAAQLRYLFPQSARIFFLSGKVAYRLRDYKDAETFLRESSRLYAHWRTQWWLGKTLTQSGRFDEAESLLNGIRERSEQVLLDLAWLYERRNEVNAALKAYDDFLAFHPEHSFAKEQRARLQAMLAAPESLIEEVSALSDLGEEISAAVFPAYVQRLFETGNTIEAREKITARMTDLDAKTGSRVAWICYNARAFDLACTLFLAHLRENLTYFKYLNALESAAAKCGRIPQVLEAYRSHATELPNLYGRLRSLARRK